MHHNKIASLRKSWALTQEELAQLLGMTRSNLSRLEVAAKTHTLDTALLLQALFGESVSEIFPYHHRAAHETLASRLAEFSTAIEEEGAVAERKRELLSLFASREPVADFAL
jgi:DNA-binding XRE family transcriptional regulator